MFNHPHLLEWTGQPKRHLLTTGWSLFVSGKRLFAGDSVIFVRYTTASEYVLLKFALKKDNQRSKLVFPFLFNTDYFSLIFIFFIFRDEKQQLLLGIRRANRQPTNISSSVLSSDSMHIGILAAAAHAAANNSPFTIFYNPRWALTWLNVQYLLYMSSFLVNALSKS